MYCNKGNNMDIKDIMKGRKKEDLAEEIVQLRVQLERTEYDANQLMKGKDAEIADLKRQLETREAEYKHWKDYNEFFLNRFMNEYMDKYMEVHKELMTDEIADKIVDGLELTDRSWGDYYSHGTDVILSYKGRQLGSASVSQN